MTVSQPGQPGKQEITPKPSGASRLTSSAHDADQKEGEPDQAGAPARGQDPARHVGSGEDDEYVPL
jgi:hypothetical protein